MQYELDLIVQLCRELGLWVSAESSNFVEIDLGQGAILEFVNLAPGSYPNEDWRECYAGFHDAGGWHFHGDKFESEDSHHCNDVCLDYLGLLAALKDGRVVIIERDMSGQVIYRWLHYSEHCDDFNYLREGERLTIRRAGKPTVNSL